MGRIEGNAMDFLSIFSIFVLACCVGYFVVWAVTPALHTPLMAVTNAISSVIIVGALIAAAAGDRAASAPTAVTAVAAEEVAVDRRIAPDGSATVAEVVVREGGTPAPSSGRGWAKWLGLLGVVLASVNIFGGFAVTERMLAMYRKKDRK
jgi:H+-translocating NAD(P) transhydrogenase subunit alpha